MKNKIISVILCVMLISMVSIIGLCDKKNNVTTSVENVANEKWDKEEEIFIETRAEENTSEDAEMEDNTPIINFWGYTGYLDECNSSYGEDFRNCDYDGDGLNDRVYRWNVDDQGDGNDTKYRIEFGNGEELILERVVPDSGFPYLFAADFSQNGKNEIVFGCSYWSSTDPMAFGELAVFEKTDDGYRQVELPMQLSDSAYTMTLDFNYQMVKEYLIQVTCTDTDFSENIVIDDTLWEQQGYKNYFTNETYNSCVWNTEIVQDGDGVPELKCYFELFDKWAACKASLLLRYRDDRFVYDGMKMEDNN